MLRSSNMNPTFNSQATISSQANLQVTLPFPPAVHDTSASNTQMQNQPHQQAFQKPFPPVHPTDFFYQPSNDFHHYYISCKEISYDTVGYLLNKSLKEHKIQSNKKECIFYYQQQCNNRLYQVSCEIASPLLINNCLNKHLLGIEFQQQNMEENLEFTLDQKENLEIHLLQYLNNYLLN